MMGNFDLALRGERGCQNSQLASAQDQATSTVSVPHVGDPPLHAAVPFPASFCGDLMLFLDGRPW